MRITMMQTAAMIRGMFTHQPFTTQEKEKAMKRNNPMSTKEVLTGFVPVVLFVMALAVFLMPAPSHAATYYVDDSQLDDSGDGTTWGTAKKTIAAAIGVSGNGDIILVKYDTYPITADIELNNTNRMIGSDDGTHNTWETADPDSELCVISASGCRAFTITGSSVTNSTRIRGFKITGGNATGETTGATYGGGIYIGDGADPVIENCWITGNIAYTGVTSIHGYGGGIACRDDGTTVTIQNCKITSNTAATSYNGHGGGIYIWDCSQVDIYNNDISYNYGSTDRGSNGGGIFCYGSAIPVM